MHNIVDRAATGYRYRKSQAIVVGANESRYSHAATATPIVVTLVSPLVLKAAIAVPTSKDNVRLALDYGLVRLKQAGTFDELYLRWFPVSFY